MRHGLPLHRHAGGAVLGLAVLLGTSPVAGPVVQDEPPPESADLAPLAEGPLDNDCFLPSAEAADEALSRGDASLRRSREDRARGRDAEAERELTAAFEGWFAALEATGTGDGTWLRSEGEVRRTVEGIEHAVLRRLHALEAAERIAWTRRFAGAAEAELSRAGSHAGSLAALERRFPATPAAARADLALCDLALEGGRLSEARELARRGLEHVALAAAPEPLAAALVARAEWCERLLAEEHSPPAAEDWTDAIRLEPTGSMALVDRETPAPSRRAVTPGRGVRPGLVFLDDDHLAVQGPLRLHLLELSAAGSPTETLSLDLRELVWEIFGEVERPRTGSEPPGWCHYPAAHRGRLYLVHGRASRRHGGAPNTLLCLDPAGAGEVDPADWSPGLTIIGQRLEGPEVRWAVSGDRVLDPEGEVRIEPALAELAEAELQPAPLRIGSAVVVQARVYDGEVRDWLLAFDAERGDLRWKRLLAKGADVSPEAGRFGTGAGPRHAAMPTILAGTRIFAGTHLGSGSLVETDGRLCWSVKNRRRSPERSGWGGGPPLWIPGLEAPEDGELLWAPTDSDRLYRLRARPLRGADPTVEELFRRPPRAMGGAEVLLGGDPHEAVLLGRSGSARTLFARREAAGDRVDSLYLGPEESFRGRGLVSVARAYASTDRGLYLFDRERELYLLDYRPLEATGAIQGGDLYARGSLIAVLGFDAIWLFRALGEGG